MRVSGTGIRAGAVISQILSTTSVTTSGTATASTVAPVTFGYPSARTLTLAGTSTDANTIAGIRQDSSSLGTGVLSIAKTGIGQWVHQMDAVDDVSYKKNLDDSVWQGIIFVGICFFLSPLFQRSSFTIW